MTVVLQPHLVQHRGDEGIDLALHHAGRADIERAAEQVLGQRRAASGERTLFCPHMKSTDCGRSVRGTAPGKMGPGPSQPFQATRRPA